MGNVTIKGQSRDSAILLLEAAHKLDLPAGVVRTVEGGFRVPAEVAEKAGFDENGEPVKKAAKAAKQESEPEPEPTPQEQQAEQEQKTADDAEQGSEEEQDFPEGEPNKDWKVEELKAYAAKHEVDLKGASRKDDVLAAVSKKG